MFSLVHEIHTIHFVNELYTRHHSKEKKKRGHNEQIVKKLLAIYKSSKKLQQLLQSVKPLVCGATFEMQMEQVTILIDMPLVQSVTA